MNREDRSCSPSLTGRAHCSCSARSAGSGSARPGSKEGPPERAFRATGVLPLQELEVYRVPERNSATSSPSTWAWPSRSSRRRTRPPRRPTFSASSTRICRSTRTKVDRCRVRFPPPTPTATPRPSGNWPTSSTRTWVSSGILDTTRDYFTQLDSYRRHGPAHRDTEPLVLRERLCACGCGASLAQMAVQARYLNDGHRQEASRRRR